MDLYYPSATKVITEVLKLHHVSYKNYLNKKNVADINTRIQLASSSFTYTLPIPTPKIHFIFNSVLVLTIFGHGHSQTRGGLWRRSNRSLHRLFLIKKGSRGDNNRKILHRLRRLGKSRWISSPRLVRRWSNFISRTYEFQSPSFTRRRTQRTRIVRVPTPYDPQSFSK